MLRSRTRRRSRRLKKTRVTVDFPSEKHKRLKAVAALRGETLQEYIIALVDERMVELPDKSKLDKLNELGLLGALEKSEITSENYKDYIKR